MPKSVPLRAMAVTIVDPSTPWAASAMALQAAITGFRTDRALSPRNRKTSSSVARSVATLAIAGASAFRNRIEPALLRL
jgi:hypothetical protein